SAARWNGSRSGRGCGARSARSTSGRSREPQRGSCAAAFAQRLREPKETCDEVREGTRQLVHPGGAGLIDLDLALALSYPHEVPLTIADAKPHGVEESVARFVRAREV